MNDYEKPDFYSKKAVKEGYVARSIFKLEELDAKFKLFKRGMKVLDLGSAPGSWSQYVSKKIGEKGLLVGIDYKDIKVSMINAEFIRGNFLEADIQMELSHHAPFDAIISDMAPDTTGDNVTDCYKSSELVCSALRFSYDFLKKGGFFIAKIFQGGDEKEIMKEMQSAFTETRWFKPKSSRSISFEIFMLGAGFIKKPEIKNKESKDLDALNNSLLTGEMPW